MFTHDKGIQFLNGIMTSSSSTNNQYSFFIIGHFLRSIIQMVLISFFILLTFQDFFIADYSESLFDILLV